MGRSVWLSAWHRPGWALPCVTSRGGSEVGRLWWAALSGMGMVQGWAVRSLFRLAVSKGIKAHLLWGLFQMHTLPRENLKKLQLVSVTELPGGSLKLIASLPTLHPHPDSIGLGMRLEYAILIAPRLFTCSPARDHCLSSTSLQCFLFFWSLTNNSGYTLQQITYTLISVELISR